MRSYSGLHSFCCGIEVGCGRSAVIITRIVRRSLDVTSPIEKRADKSAHGDLLPIDNGGHKRVMHPLLEGA